jgi:hypothetical protein
VREIKKYNVKNRSEQDRIVLIEHPYRPDFKLVSKEKPKERARDVYRFEVPVAAGKGGSEEIIEEREFVNHIAIALILSAPPNPPRAGFGPARGRILSDRSVRGLGWWRRRQVYSLGRC